MPAGVEFVMYFPIRYNNYETSFHCGEHSGRMIDHLCFLVFDNGELVSSHRPPPQQKCDINRL